uniref:Glycosyltransferase n=1 Tax=viral metagenome TaxID=1070528 RepID=A0A6H1ZGM5_9ZZZZ
MNITIGIMSHEPSELLERCLKSLIDIDAGVPYELKLQLTPGTNPENWNRLFAKCNGDLVCMLEDDTAALRPMWLKSLVDTMLRFPDCGLVMPVETKDGIRPDPGFVPWLNKTSQVIQTFGFCNLIRKGIDLKADENLTYFVDIDLAYQIQQANWKCYCNGHVQMLHGATQGRLSNASDIIEKQREDREYLAKKWSLQDAQA